MIAIGGEWFAGFVDGEGSLNIASHKGKAQPRFRLNQRDDDGDLVRAIRGFLGVGSLYRKLDRQNPNAQPQLGLAVIGGDCAAVVRVLDLHPLRSKKRHEYPSWRSAVMDYVATPLTRWSDPGLRAARDARLRGHKLRLELIRTYGGPT